MRKSHWSHRRRKPSFQVSLLTLESERASATLGAKVPQEDKDISFPGTLRDTSHLPRGPCMAGGPVGRGEVSLHSHTPPHFCKVETLSFPLAGVTWDKPGTQGGSSVGRIMG